MATKPHLPGTRLDETHGAIKDLETKRLAVEAAALAQIAALDAERKRLAALTEPLNAARSERARLLSRIENVQRYREIACVNAAELEELLGAALLADDGGGEAWRVLHANPHLSASGVLIARADRLLDQLRAEVPALDEKISTLSAQTV